MMRTARTVLLLTAITWASCGYAQQAPVLNEDIKVVSFHEFSYPVAARLKKVEGIVVVQVALNDRGEVISAFAISGPKMMIPATVSNAQNWRFQANGQKSAIIVYHFRFDGLCNLPCASRFHFVPPNLAVITTGDPVVDH